MSASSPKDKDQISDSRSQWPIGSEQSNWVNIHSTFSSHFGRGFMLYFVPSLLLAKAQLKSRNLRASLASGLFAGFVGTWQRGLFLLKRARAEEQGVTIDQVVLQPWEKFLHNYGRGIAGAIFGGVAILVEGGDITHGAFTFWLLVRAVRTFMPSEGLLNAIVKNVIGFNPNICGATVMMCLTASHILSTWIRHPEQLDRPYLQFLNYHGGQPPEVMEFMRLEPHHRHVCDGIHPTYSQRIFPDCYQHTIAFFARGLLRSVKLYFPLHLVLTLLAKYRKPDIDFLKLLTGFGVNLGRSTVFLSLYCTLAWFGACHYYWFFQVPATRWNLATHTWISGLATLIEAPSRREELASYCTTYSLSSLYKYLVTKGYVQKKSPSVFFLLAAISAGFLLQNHVHNNEMLMRWLLNIR